MLDSLGTDDLVKWRPLEPVELPEITLNKRDGKAQQGGPPPRFHDFIMLEGYPYALVTHRRGVQRKGTRAAPGIKGAPWPSPEMTRKPAPSVVDARIPGQYRRFPAEEFN